jgi:hypothetical protein
MAGAHSNERYMDSSRHASLRTTFFLAEGIGCSRISGLSRGARAPSDTRFLYDMEICVIRPDGSGRRQLTDNNYFDGHPSW